MKLKSPGGKKAAGGFFEAVAYTLTPDPLTNIIDPVMEFPIRLNKYLAQKGLATRRSADLLIESGKVLVNKKPATLGQKVFEGDEVRLVGQKKQFRYYIYYKPFGVVTHSPALEETDIAWQIKHDHHVVGVFPVGRLDKTIEGLMLLTDDGRVTEPLLRSTHAQTYEVTVDKRVTQTSLNRLAKGMTVDGKKIDQIEARSNPRNERSFTLVLGDARKNNIKHICAALGYLPIRIIRTRAYTLSLRKHVPGSLYQLKKQEVEVLFQKIGLGEKR